MSEYNSTSHYLKNPSVPTLLEFQCCAFDIFTIQTILAISLFQSREFRQMKVECKYAGHSLMYFTWNILLCTRVCFLSMNVLQSLYSHYLKKVRVYFVILVRLVRLTFFFLKLLFYFYKQYLIYHSEYDRWGPVDVQ